MRHCVIVLISLLLSLNCFAKEEKRQCKMDRDYWLYTPDNFDSKKTYWLVVGVHGYGGKGAGAAGLKNWISKFDNVIVVGPSFPNQGYQRLMVGSAKQLLNIQKSLAKEFKLHKKMFLYGFSGGSQFAHRFAGKYPKNVIGVSSHSGGTWDKGPGRRATTVLWTLSCGLNDKAVSAGAPAPRIDCFRAFYKNMNKGKFTSKAFVTEAGHAATKEVRAASEECFRVSSSGMFDYQRQATEKMTVSERENWLKKDNQLEDIEFNDGKTSYQLKVNKDGWTVAKSTLKSMLETRKTLDKLNK